MIEPKHLIIIGAQRSGSTMLYEWLDHHPEVYMARPAKPEPKYFLQEDVDLKSYGDLFKESPNKVTYWGEKSTSYYETAEVAERIHRILPNAILLVMLRDPVDRAISNYHFSKVHGLETRTLKEVFLDQVAEPPYSPHVSVNPFNYLKRGQYAEHLKPFVRLFGSRLIVLQFERFIGDEDYRNQLLESLNLGLGPMPAPSKANEGVKVEKESGEQVRSYLRGYYQPMMQELSEAFGMNLNYWMQ